MTIEELTGNIAFIAPLMDGYKQSVSEPPLTTAQYAALESALREGSIHFFVARDAEKPVAMCSVSRTFSTYTCNYGGVFEDSYIAPEYRGSGLARILTEHVFAYCTRNGIYSLWVGCAQCDVDMYRHLGFDIPLGNLLTWAADL